MSDKQKDLIREVFLRNGFKIKAGADDLADYVYEAARDLLQVAPAVQGEPVAWIRKWSLDGEKPTKERNKNGRMAYPMEHKLHEVTRNRFLPDDVALYTAPQPAPETGECHKITAWVVYDATSAQKYIKMDADTGCLAFFDTERLAALFAAHCPGADYEKLVLYSCPQPAPDAALPEAFDAGRRAAQAEAAELAKALDGMIEAADVASWGGYFPDAAITRAVEALAAYRKQEPSHDNQ